MNDSENKNKEGELGSQNPTNPTETGQIELTEEQKAEQERTTTNKKLFLEYFPKCNLNISRTCDKINISRDTYYDWRDTDPEFKNAVIKVRQNMMDEMEDALIGLALIQKDGPSIRYWLDRKHPEYTPRSKVENFVGTKTLDELLSGDDAKVEQEQKEYDEKHKNETGKEIKQGTDREITQNPKQEGGTGAVQIQHGPELLLEKKDETKPNSESETKGNQQGDRRRPTPRLRSERY